MSKNSPDESLSIVEPKNSQEKTPLEPPETYTQFGQAYNVYYRETLYKEIWEYPFTELSKKYQVSDVTIRKICKTLNIPTPPAGHWAKLRAGKPVKKIALPKSSGTDKMTGVRTGAEYRSPQNLQQDQEELAFLSPEKKADVLSAAAQAKLPDETKKMHSIIIAHRKKIAEWKKADKQNNRRWNQRNADPAPFLADSISDESLPRICRILDALIKITQPLGCSLDRDLSFIVEGETVPVYVSEAKDQITHVITKEEHMQLLEYEDAKKRRSWASEPKIRKYDQIYSGRICIRFDVTREFRDRKSNIIEDRLGDMVIALYQAAEAVRIKREEREEAERKRREEEKRKENLRESFNTEIDRTLSLINEADDYEMACKVRRYIAAVEASGEPDEKTLDWIEWAKSKADWLDPLVDKEDVILGKRVHGDDEEKKKLKHKSYYW